MNGDSFFAEQTGQSEAKARIVQKYFWAWAKVMLSQRHVSKIAYIDLFAGPGRYEEGKMSTPLLVLKQTIADPVMCKALVTLFNDKDSEAVDALKKAIDQLPGIEKLKFKPNVESSEVGSDIIEMFEEMKLVPTLFFVDPWGYKGLSLRLINSVLKDWGCDCIFFFNYNRVNMGLNNDFVRSHIDALFGKKLAQKLRSEVEGKRAAEREQLIVEGICQAIRSYGNRYILPFCFKDNRGKRTSHHLFFVTKNFLGYDIMKGIMAKESSDDEQGVPSFAYNPANLLYHQSLLFQMSRPLEDLKQRLVDNYEGKSIVLKTLYAKDSVDTPYVMKNYKQILLEMEEEGLISVHDPLRKKRRSETLADRLQITFR